MNEEKGQPKRGVEPASFRYPAERLTTRPSRLTQRLCPPFVRAGHKGIATTQQQNPIHSQQAELYSDLPQAEKNGTPWAEGGGGGGGGRGGGGGGGERGGRGAGG